jgi:predicted nucleic acid-binding protein
VKTDGILLDTGPLVAFFDQSEQFHGWADEQFGRVNGVVLTCEAVITEALFLLRRTPEAQRKLLGFVAEDVISIRFDLREEIVEVRALWEHYRDVPMSLADACLVRMSEIWAGYPLLTLDSDFRIYRRHRRQQIRCIVPSGM